MKELVCFLVMYIVFDIYRLLLAIVYYIYNKLRAFYAYIRQPDVYNKLFFESVVFRTDMEYTLIDELLLFIIVTTSFCVYFIAGSSF